MNYSVLLRTLQSCLISEIHESKGRVSREADMGAEIGIWENYTMM